MIHTQLGQEVSMLKSQLATAMNELETHVKVQNNTKLQLSKLEQSVSCISQQRYKLQSAIKEHERSGPEAIQHIPFEFF
jgi:predicted  nucleic acid-binding Zn-ribbon protein